MLSFKAFSIELFSCALPKFKIVVLRKITLKCKNHNGIYRGLGVEADYIHFFKKWTKCTFRVLSNHTLRVRSHWILYSGVVGRERMGTAFPHKKLGGNGVPTRKNLRDMFLLLLCISYFPLLPCNSIPHFRASQTMSN